MLKYQIQSPENMGKKNLFSVGRITNPFLRFSPENVFHPVQSFWLMQWNQSPHSQNSPTQRTASNLL